MKKKDCDRTLLLCSLLLLLPVHQVAAHGGDHAPKVAGVGGDQVPQVMKLWEFMNSSDEIFPFKTINQILELNYELKEENTRLKREVESNSESIIQLWESLDQKISELKMEMKNNLEVEMEAKDQRIDSLETDMKTKDNALKSEIEAKDRKIAALKKKMKRLRGRMTETEETDLQLREMVDQVRNPPFAFQCAFRDYWSTDDSTIFYDRLMTDTDMTGGLNIDTGVFTVGFSGVYTITYSLMSNQKGGLFSLYNEVYLYLNNSIYLNNGKIEESFHKTSNLNSNAVFSLGSRTLYMRLEEGDQVTLRTGKIYELAYITVCFELSQFDYNPVISELWEPDKQLL